MRLDGYAPLRDYAAVGDGRTTALVARDGSIDWLCLPNVDSPSIFGAILDAHGGGCFSLAPAVPFETERRYLPGSNVLETTFRTATGVVRLLDALTFGDVGRLGPLREVVRRVEGVAGNVPMTYRVDPRFGYGAARVEYGRRAGRPFAASGADALALSTWGAGEPEVGRNGFAGSFETAEGSFSQLAVSIAHGEPVLLPGLEEIELRWRRTLEFWPEWSGQARYDGPWRDAVVRSALVLKLCVFAPSGAIVAAPTTALPESLGGSHNWDYRFTWVRDASWTLGALLQLGYTAEANAFFWWLMHASRRTQPQLTVLYRVGSGEEARERVLDHLEGYRGSAPVRIGNGAAGQRQLDIYGAFLSAVGRYARDGGRIDRDTAKEVAAIADHVCKVWRSPDSGIWEVRRPATHFVQSKAMCWVALDRAARLADEGVIPSRRAARWRAEAAAVEELVDRDGWDAERGSYTRATDLPETDASLLTLALLDWPNAERSRRTVDAVRRELADGPWVYRYRGEDGVGDEAEEGAFVTCSFWLVEALARTGRVGEAEELMDDLVAQANDVGLYAEEADPRDGSFLGNFPQALSHLALVNAAVAIEEHR